MKTIEFTYGPVVLNLYMNGSAMFEIQALDDGIPEDQPDAIERMKENTAEGFTLVCKIAHILATQGELCRRYLQYTPRRIPDFQELLTLLSPVQILSLRIAVFRAINNGYDNGSAEGSDDGDIDIGLAELEKKKKTLTLPFYLRMAAINHIQPREALLLLTPGEVTAMFELWAESKGVKRSDD